jgi:hypothetical protein
MSKDNQISFQVYRQPITNVRPIKLITLEYFLGYTKDPPQSIIGIFNMIAAAERSGDKQAKDNLKQKYLHYFTPCVVVGLVRRYESIQHFTGILVLDFDHIDNARDFKYFLFEEYPCMIAVWLSPSRRGVKSLIKIPVVTSVAEFKEFYFGIAAEMEVYNGFDPSGQNSVLPLFQSYDPDLLYRTDVDTWTVKGVKQSDFTTAPVCTVLKITPTDKDKLKVVQIIRSGFDNIVDCGHPQLRSLSITIGGYIANGYINEYEAIQMFNYEIETHPYLKKRIEGYKKTALWAIRQGQSKPLTLYTQ